MVWAVKHFRHYLYGHHCTVLTDHEALKSLLHTPHPSGKLARWGMALQELDLTIEYRPGSRNRKADALSRYPVSLLHNDKVDESAPTIVAAIEGSVDDPDMEEQQESTLSERQRLDPDLQLVIAYLEDDTLPDNDRKARELVLGKTQYTMVDRVLYRIESDKTLRVVVAKSDRQNLFNEAHSGTVPLRYNVALARASRAILLEESSV